ncbi:MAG TPA: hypothetical protein O0X27_06230, partial [Methanocorpusculum sp.]|nr:hypothetical protein [Methanocorpusculum sp.]
IVDMSDTRKLTVGVTINLGTSGTLHLEVSDTAETEYDADDLRTFLADALAGYGTNDSAVRATIDGYRRRVLADAETDATPDEEPFGISADDAVSMDLFSAGSSAAEEETLDEPADPSLDDEEEDKREEIDEADYLRLPPAPLVEESAEEFVCSKCGATVSKLQRDVSMLFNHKILCKDCMK